MRRTIIILLLIYSSVILAQQQFNRDIADSLFTGLRNEIDFEESYYLINSDNSKFNFLAQRKLLEIGVDIRNRLDQASKSIQLTITSDISYEEKKSFLFSRQMQVQRYYGQALIINNDTSRIEKNISYSLSKKKPVKDGTITLWKPVLLSLFAGTLVYSLWSIE